MSEVTTKSMLMPGTEEVTGGGVTGTFDVIEPTTFAVAAFFFIKRSVNRRFLDASTICVSPGLSQFHLISTMRAETFDNPSSGSFNNTDAPSANWSNVSEGLSR